MKLTKSKQVFNLMNTNGRRADIINAYTIYMEILDEMTEKNGEVNFTSFPNSWNQFKFYQEAIKRSPEVFEDHPIYDNFIEKLKEPNYYKAFEKRSVDDIKELPKGNKLLKSLDEGIEMRARHYTSNLNKIGFIKSNREMTSVGRSFVKGSNIERGEFEKLLPIDDINLIFMRQLIKLRIYNSECNSYYSPMIMCLYILLSNETISVQDLKITVQLLTPEYVVDPVAFFNDVKVNGLEYVENKYISYDEGFSFCSQKSP